MMNPSFTRIRIVAPHKASFEIYPVVKAGESVLYLRDDEENPSWFWGRDANGLEGYLPKGFFVADNSRNQWVAKRDYTARELTIQAGVEVSFLEKHEGWCLIQAGEEVGWVPVECLESTPAPDQSSS